MRPVWISVSNDPLQPCNLSAMKTTSPSPVTSFSICLCWTAKGEMLNLLNCFDLNRTTHLSPPCAEFLMSAAWMHVYAVWKRMTVMRNFWRKSPCVAAPEAIYDVHENHPVKWSGQAGGAVRVVIKNAFIDFFAEFIASLCGKVTHWNFLVLGWLLKLFQWQLYDFKLNVLSNSADF